MEEIKNYEGKKEHTKERKSIQRKERKRYGKEGRKERRNNLEGNYIKVSKKLNMKESKRETVSTA